MHESICDTAMRPKLTRPESPAIINFAEMLYQLFPDFIPTRTLYIDLEGRQSGSEDILSLYWPAVAGNRRFSWLKRNASSGIQLEDFYSILDRIGANKPRWVMVFSAGKEEPDEQVRLNHLFGRNVFPGSRWVNLHHVVQKSRALKLCIREHRNVWHCSDKKRVRYSLEALEWEFGIIRPTHIRGHNNCYQDQDGKPGLMQVLSSAKKSIEGSASQTEEKYLQDYCKSDVRNMFLISAACERALFTRGDRKSRRRSMG